MKIELDFYATLLCLVFVLFLGKLVIQRVEFLRKYDIPKPVVGGIIVAVVLTILYKYANIEFLFDTELKEPLMLAFFSSIGLMANFASLKKGGSKLVIFLVVVCGLLILQNAIGVLIANALGEQSMIGLLAGSITMSGGHGTGAAWAHEFAKAPHNFSSAMEVAMTSATFGLVAGGFMGGPIANYLIKKHKLKSNAAEQSHIHDAGNNEIDIYEDKQTHKKYVYFTETNFLANLSLIAICLYIGTELSHFVKDTLKISFTLPTFVYCLFTGLVLRHLLSAFKVHNIIDEEVKVLGNVSLSLFLAFALMTLKLWELLDLALPLLTILSAQVILMALYVIFVTFPVCGSNYDAAVLCAGHCGFGLGATPTAMVNIQTVTEHYGMSYISFIIIPLCGAFFIDIVNSIVINFFVSYLL